MKRERQDEDASSDGGGVVIMAETQRNASTPPPAKSGEEHLPMFWRLFGGTIISIAALAIITMYNQLSTNISELRSEITRLQEARAELVKKDDANNRFHTLSDRLVATQTQQSAHTAAMTSLQTVVDGLKERLVAYRADADTARKDLATEMKAEKVDLAKLRQDVESNRAQDLERKKFRDEQNMTMTETLKELERAIREHSEKLARLEGQLSPPKPKSSSANTRTESGTRQP